MENHRTPIENHSKPIEIIGKTRRKTAMRGKSVKKQRKKKYTEKEEI